MPLLRSATRALSSLLTPRVAPPSTAQAFVHVRDPWDLPRASREIGELLRFRVEQGPAPLELLGAWVDAGWSAAEPLVPTAPTGDGGVLDQVCESIELSGVWTLHRLDGRSRTREELLRDLERRVRSRGDHACEASLSPIFSSRLPIGDVLYEAGRLRRAFPGRVRSHIWQNVEKGDLWPELPPAPQLRGLA